MLIKPLQWTLTAKMTDIQITDIPTFLRVLNASLVMVIKTHES